MVVTELWGLMGKSWNNRTAVDSMEEEADGGAEESTGCLERQEKKVCHGTKKRQDCYEEM